MGRKNKSSLAVPTRFVEDSWRWSPRERYLGLHLLTCRERAIECHLGLIPASADGIRRELAPEWPVSHIESLMANLEERGWLVADGGWVFIPSVMEVSIPHGRNQIVSVARRLHGVRRDNRAWEAFLAAVEQFLPEVFAEIKEPTPIPKTKPKQGIRDRFAYLLADPCAYCGAPSVEIDHIVPRAAGGRDEAGNNLAGACWRCNSAKNDTPLLHFLLHGRRRRR